MALQMLPIAGVVFFSGVETLKQRRFEGKILGTGLYGLTFACPLSLPSIMFFASHQSVVPSFDLYATVGC